MLKIVAKRYLKDGVFDEYVEVVRPLVEQSRQEAGCIEYALYANRQLNLAVMIETWADQQSLEQHLEIVRKQGYPEKLNAYADPERSVQVEQYAYVY